MLKKVSVLLLTIVSAVSAQESSPGERFYRAIRHDDLPTLRTLVRQFGVDSRGSLGQTPLMLAVAFGSSEAVELLLKAGADPKAATSSGVTALHWSRGDAKKVGLLVAHGADVNARSQIGRTPLIVAASSYGSEQAVRLLLDHGADVNAADNIGFTPLMAACNVDDTAVATLLLARGARVDVRAADTGQAATPLMAAAYNGNVDLARLLLARGARADIISGDRSAVVKNGPVQFGNNTALHMAVIGGNVDLVERLLEAGAAVDAQDVRGMTPLMWAVSTDRPQLRILRALLTKGADPSLRSKSGESAQDWARKFNDATVLRELELMPVRIGGEPSIDVPAMQLAARAAVERSMPLMRRASARMLSEGGCVACHAQPVTAMAVRLASDHGWHVDPPDPEVVQVTTRLSAEVTTLLQSREGGGLPDTHVYNAMMMAALEVPSSLTTDVLMHYLAAKQRPEGHWRGTGATRAPMQDGDFARTAMAVRALSVYPTPARKAEMARRLDRAAAWLAREEPVATDDRVMQLLGLHWANAHAGVREKRTRELIALQRPDGGWAQTPHLASDAYATGRVLFALRALNIPATHSVLQRGVRFLLRSQREDGTWHVKSRAMKVQPYFESGFPHGHDQWISQAATAWAAMGLTVTAVESPAVATARR